MGGTFGKDMMLKFSQFCFIKYIRGTQKIGLSKKLDGLCIFMIGKKLLSY
jgi:hypothetical protein